MMKAILITLLLTLSNFALAEGAKTTVLIEGMTCPSCAASVEKQLKKFPEVVSVDIGLRSGKATITFKEGKTLTPEQVKRAVKDAGYSVRSLE